MIDLHCHVLPNVDDGADSLEVSRRMLLKANEYGFKTLVATPHLYDALDPAYDALVKKAFAQVLPLARVAGITLLPGFEIRLTSHLVSRLEAGELSTLVNTRTVLVDLSGTGLPHFTEGVLFSLQTAGFRPILAHPERYPEIQDEPELGLRMVERGVALQVTIGSLSGAFGRRAQRAAEALLQLGAVHLVASDAHSDGHRQTAVPEGLRRLWKLVGSEQYHRALIDAPHALISGEPLPPPIKSSKTSFRSKLPLLRNA